MADPMLPLTIAGTVHTSTAALSPCGRYRYELLRRWDLDLPLLDVQMLNPSKADAERNDPTINRLVGTPQRPGFARRWGFGAIRVTNRFALRATDPAELLVDPDPIGPENFDYLRRPAATTLVAWGAHAAVRLRAPAGGWPEPQNAVCLGVTAAGEPRHPLYVRADTEPVPWPM